MIMLTKLFEPGKIGNISVRNRIVMPPMQTRGADSEGFVTDRLIDYYAERARGGTGLIIVQQSFAWPEAKLERGIALWEDKYIPRLRDLARAVKSYGARVAIQLGSRGTGQQEIGTEKVAPSAIPTSWGGSPRELTPEEIAYYVEAFAEASRRARDAGFDAIEIHGAHGHLISQFLSPYTNRRTDEYGGSVENRTRFALRIINRIREIAGAEFHIIFRMNADDFIEGGITLEEAIQQAKLLVEAGVAALHVSGSCHESIWNHQPSYFYPQGNLVHLASQIKKAVNIPVITVGKINDPLFAEEILSGGKADFIAMGRALIADPELPNKAREGRFDDIRRCLYCCNCLTWERRPRLHDRGISCTVNPAVLREKEFAIKLASDTKRIMVIGGGLAGMEAARTLAERGHRVSLYEKRGYLGGQWTVAAWPDYKIDYKTLIPFLERGMEKAGVKVSLNTWVTRQLVEKEKPDTVVIATGAVPKSLDVEVQEGANPKIYQANDVLTGKAKVRNEVVVIGGRYLGMEVANILARQGKRVSLVEALELGHGTQLGLKAVLRNRLVEQGVYFYPRSPVMRVTSTGVDVANNGSLLHLNADTVVLAVGTRPVNDLISQLDGLEIKVYTIGDCVETRDAMEAINEGAEIGRVI